MGQLGSHCLIEKKLVDGAILLCKTARDDALDHNR